MSQTDIIPHTDMSPQVKTKVAEIAKSIDLHDPALTITYGTQTMNNIAGFADGLLSRVRAKDAGPVGENLTNLLLKVKDIDVTALSQEQGGFLHKIPLIGSLFDSAQKSVARFNTLSGQIDTITGQLDQAMVGLLKDIEVLEQLYEHNREYHEQLSLYIEAGKERLEQARTVELPRLQEQAAASGDSMAAQNVKDFADKINRFERRLHDLQLSRTITVQTAPQIRLIQSNNQTLAEKIQTSILATIPIWKSQMVLALSLHGQQKAVNLQREVANTTNELLRKNAEMLQTATIDTAREAERSIVDVETLREVQSKLINTIEETLRISEEGRAQRREVEQEIQTMESELRTRLTGLAQEKTRQSLESASGTAPAVPQTTPSEPR